MSETDDHSRSPACTLIDCRYADAVRSRWNRPSDRRDPGAAFSDGFGTLRNGRLAYGIRGRYDVVGSATQCSIGPPRPSLGSETVLRRFSRAAMNVSDPDASALRSTRTIAYSRSIVAPPLERQPRTNSRRGRSRHPPNRWPPAGVGWSRSSAIGYRNERYRSSGHWRRPVSLPSERATPAIVRFENALRNRFPLTEAVEVGRLPVRRAPVLDRPH